MNLISLIISSKTTMTISLKKIIRPRLIRI